MGILICKWLNKWYPQNYIIKNPLIGFLFFLGICIFFVIVYKPLLTHESRFFSPDVTVTIYCLIVAIPLFGLIKILKSFRYFSDPDEWTVLKEISAIILSLLGMGILVYLSGFLLEPPIQRWNLVTFFDSLYSAFLIFAVPISIFSLINYRYLLVSDIIKQFNTETNFSSSGEYAEIIRIESQLKKRSWTFTRIS